MTESQLTFVEKVNPHYCNILSKISYTQFTTFYNNEDEQGETGECIKPYTQYSMLRKYCNAIIANNYKINTSQYINTLITKQKDVYLWITS